ncbi:MULTISPECIES: hypothetical protein [unclassified Haladaptatus]|uniref:hypothetical protein n=1 Tax=unclassified Haladaptatus TaxID=2622732 RepID=UPI00209C69D6|nr:MULTISPECIES: hypothetical protein [unclassified Haladaptatus]MCO8245642.1 hypothetical protein [Haladaptatus sp. AB643]MCO8255470.1 hypothetical protein [Haladaptatus sp. AB618]
MARRSVPYSIDRRPNAAAQEDGTTDDDGEGDDGYTGGARPGDGTSTRTYYPISQLGTSIHTVPVGWLSGV